MATKGETFSQSMPTTIAITGATSGSFTVTPALVGDTTVSSNTAAGIVAVDAGRVYKANTKDASSVTSSGKDEYPVIVGQATITITAAAGTQVHYTLNGKNPTFKATKKSTADSTAANLRMNRSRMGAARVYEGAFTIDNGRPGDSMVVLRLRAYKIDASAKLGISPNEKSPVLIVKFVLKNTSY